MFVGSLLMLFTRNEHLLGVFLIFLNLVVIRKHSLALQKTLIKPSFKINEHSVNIFWAYKMLKANKQRQTLIASSLQNIKHSLFFSCCWHVGSLNSNLLFKKTNKTKKKQWEIQVELDSFSNKHSQRVTWYVLCTESFIFIVVDYVMQMFCKFCFMINSNNTPNKYLCCWS